MDDMLAAVVWKDLCDDVMLRLLLLCAAAFSWLSKLPSLETDEGREEPFIYTPRPEVGKERFSNKLAISCHTAATRIQVRNTQPGTCILCSARCRGRGLIEGSG